MKKTNTETKTSNAHSRERAFTAKLAYWTLAFGYWQPLEQPLDQSYFGIMEL